MPSIAGIEIPPDETPIHDLRPVVFAFGKYYELVGIYFLAALGWMVFTLYGGSAAASVPWYGELAIYWLLLMVPAVGAGVLWISKQPVIYSALAGVAGTLLAAWVMSTTVTIPSVLGGYFGNTATLGNSLPAFLGLAAVIGFVFVQAYRRGHHYIITPRRIILAKTFWGRTSREIHYDKIADLIVTTSFWGRRLHYGTVIPVSESGLGLGGDISGVAAGGTVKIRNLTVGGAVIGGREVNVPRAATYYELYGVHDPERVHGEISDHIYSFSEAPILKRIEGLLQEGASSKQEKKDTTKGEPEKEQIA
jgi:PH (Pleckstrin Homology) domain-containing protein